MKEAILVSLVIVGLSLGHVGLAGGRSGDAFDCKKGTSNRKLSSEKIEQNAEAQTKKKEEPTRERPYHHQGILEK